MKKQAGKFISFIFLEILSLFLFSKGSWTVDNLSMIGNIPKYRPLYFFWAFLFCLTFFKPLIHLKITKKSFSYQFLCKTAFITFLLNVILPFDIDSTNFLSLLHIPLASISLICILLAVFYALNYVKETLPVHFSSLARMLEAILSILFITILIFSQVNSIVEFLFITLTIPYLYYLDNLTS